ncbi:MAG: diphosphomevalonate decarboxylase [Gammaproteobacteria bacterium]
MNKAAVVASILAGEIPTPISHAIATEPANIALAKYWGKRNEELNLPITGSLSISLGKYGATTEIAQHSAGDLFLLNGNSIEPNSEFSTRLKLFLDLFRPYPEFYFTVKTQSKIPIAAGVASSAAGFAALTRALNVFFGWNLTDSMLSILARLGSGSACRSLWHGFVEWQPGTQEDGMDSFAKPIPSEWRDLRIGLLLFNIEKKAISSRKAMQQTVLSSPFYREWPQHVAKSIQALHQAISQQDFILLGKTAESNALAMHATMLTADPTICYWQPETVTGMQKVWHARNNGLPLYFTQDAGPNLKLLFLQEHSHVVKDIFPEVTIIDPWDL